MIERMIDMIEKHAEEMADELKQRLLSGAGTSSYRVLDDKALYQRIFELYSRFGYWLLGDLDKEEIRTYYSNFGAELFEEGFPLHEAIQGLVVTKRQIWDAFMKKGLFDSGIALDSAIDFITLIHRYFDLAVYHTIQKYCSMLSAQMGKMRINIIGNTPSKSKEA